MNNKIKNNSDEFVYCDNVRCPNCCSRDKIIKINFEDYKCLNCGCIDEFHYFNMRNNEMLYSFKKDSNGEMQLYFGTDEESMISVRDYLEFLHCISTGSFTVIDEDEDF